MTREDVLLNQIGQQAASHASAVANLVIELDKLRAEIVSLRADNEALKKSLTEKA